jgi:hypothetical protein
LFIVDNVDGLNNEEIRNSVPRQAMNILLSTCDPSLTNALQVNKIGPNDTVAIITNVLKNKDYSKDLFTKKELEEIACIVQGHPFGAALAISYITQVLA